MINLNAGAKKFLKKTSKKEFDQLWGRIEGLENNPRPHDSEHVSGYPGCFRITVGEFRVVYSFRRVKPAAHCEQTTAKTHAPDHTLPCSVKVVVVERKNDKAAYKKLKKVMGKG